MKRIVILVLCGLLIGVPRFVLAETGWGITNFHSDITVRADASIEVHETITVTFAEERHGIFRELPLVATFNGKKVHLPINTVSVQQDGKSASVDTSSTKQLLTLKIGDPDVLISGEHTYDIFYQVVGAVNFFETFDELNWNVTGTNWPVPITKASAIIRIPGDSTPTTLCYTGPQGSTAQNCSGVASTAEARYSAEDTLTVVSHWPKGVVTMPTTYKQDRKLPPALTTTDVVGIAVGSLIALGSLWGLWRKWTIDGRDPEEPKTIMAQYEPPAGLTPAEAQVVMNQSANQVAVTATIIDLAVRGYLRIEEREVDKLIGKKKEYALIRRQSEKSLQGYEKTLMEILFSPDYSDTPGEIIISELKKHQRTIYTEMEALRKSISASATAKGMFMENPTKVSGRLVLIGVLCLTVDGAILAFTGLPSIGALAILVGIGIAGVLCFLFSVLMPRRTEKGAKTRWQLKGFKLFLTTAEKYRLQWQEKEHIFETFLPYAIIFGVTEKWAKTFADMAMSNPEWYSGTTAWSAVSATKVMNSFSTSLNSAVIPSDGGSSGGGSGGGGGGGGGGSW